MIIPRLTNCIECNEIPQLLSDIDCKLLSLAKVFYNNITLMLNKEINSEAMLDLLNYKRILIYRSYNVDYASDFTMEMIASRVNILKYR